MSQVANFTDPDSQKLFWYGEKVVVGKNGHLNE